MFIFFILFFNYYTESSNYHSPQQHQEKYFHHSSFLVLTFSRISCDPLPEPIFGPGQKTFSRKKTSRNICAIFKMSDNTRHQSQLASCHLHKYIFHAMFRNHKPCQVLKYLFLCQVNNFQK